MTKKNIKSQSLLGEGLMERYDSDNQIFENSKKALYYFSDSRRRIVSQYMQHFEPVPADCTLRFAYIQHTQNYVYALTEDGLLYQWNLNDITCGLYIFQFTQKKKIKKIFVFFVCWFLCFVAM